MASLASQPRRVREALVELKRKIAERFQDRLVDLRLFGSRARGQAGPESDTDILVVLDHAGWEERRQLIDLATDVGLEYDLLLSPTVFDRATYDRWREQRRPLVVEIERDGIAL